MLLLCVLLVLAITCAVLLSLGVISPLESLIFLAAALVAAICIVLYMAELLVVGWIVDFLDWITMGAHQAQPPNLDYEQIDEIVVVTLAEDIVTVWQCQAVQKQLKRLIDEHRCDFILDFSGIDRITSRFREVLVLLTKAARREAAKLGRPYRPIGLRGDLFRVFDDRESAVTEMGRHGGHGWVVLCSVPAGLRAVSK